MEDLVSWWCLEEWIISCMQVCFCYIEGYDLTIVCFSTCGCVALWSFFVLIMLGSASFHSFVLCKFCFLGWCGDLDSMGLGGMGVCPFHNYSSYLSFWMIVLQSSDLHHVSCDGNAYLLCVKNYLLFFVGSRAGNPSAHGRQAGRQMCEHLYFSFLAKFLFKVPFITWY